MHDETCIVVFAEYQNSFRTTKRHRHPLNVPILADPACQEPASN